MKRKNLILFIVLLCLISVLFLLITTYISYISPKNSSLSYNTPLNPTTQSSIPSIIPHNSFVFVRNGDIWISNSGQEKQLTHDSRSEKLGYFEDIIFYYSNPSVSPDRTKIAFFSFNDKASSSFPQLHVMNADGTGKRVVANDIDSTSMPRILWSFNSKKIFYITVGTRTDQIIEEEKIVYAIDITSGIKQKLGSYLYGVGCGGGSVDMADGLVSSEDIVGLGGRLNTFIITPDENLVIHTINCTIPGIGILNLLTKKDTLIDQESGSALVSPDGSRIALFDQHNIRILDTRTLQFLKKYALPTAILSPLWSSDGNALYYSSRELIKQHTYEDEWTLKVFGSSPVEYTIYQSSVSALSLDSGKTSKIGIFDMHGVKPFYEVPNSPVLYVSTVDNSTALFDHIMNKRMVNDISDYEPKVHISAIDTVLSKSTTIIKNAEQSTYIP